MDCLWHSRRIWKFLVNKAQIYRLCKLLHILHLSERDHTQEELSSSLREKWPSETNIIGGEDIKLVVLHWYFHSAYIGVRDISHWRRKRKFEYRSLRYTSLKRILHLIWYHKEAFSLLKSTTSFFHTLSTCFQENERNISLMWPIRRPRFSPVFLVREWRFSRNFNWDSVIP